MAQHIGDLRQKRTTGALTTHYTSRHQFQGFSPQNTNQIIYCQPLWKIQDAATKNLLETAAIQATHQGGHLLNKDFGPSPTLLSFELGKILPDFNCSTYDYEVPMVLAAKPTATRNGIFSLRDSPESGNTNTADRDNPSQQVGLRVTRSAASGTRSRPQ
jgi:hypothetical protein